MKKSKESKKKHSKSKEPKQVEEKVAAAPDIDLGDKKRMDVKEKMNRATI